MAFTTVITHATGDVFPAADWNTYIRDNVNAIHAGLAGTTTYILNGTISYTAATGTSALQLEAVGGGGGSGGCPASGATTQLSLGAPGGGGGYGRKLITANIGTHAVAVGAGGSAGGSGTTSGGNGGDTTFNDSVGTQVAKGNGATGGAAGEVVTGGNAATFSIGGAAGSGVGDLVLQGQRTTWQNYRVSGSLGATVGGPAGGLYQDGNNNSVRTGSTGVAGSAGFFPGGGAAGGIDTNNTARAGAAGANGILIVRAWG